MSKIQELIDARALPELMKKKRGGALRTVADYEKRREELKRLLQDNEYGVIPPKPEHMSVEILSENPRFCAGRATLRELKMTVTREGKETSFRFKSLIPNAEGRYPAFIHISFRPEVPNPGLPAEEIVDNGFAIFMFDYRDVAGDNNDFRGGCARFLCESRRKANAPGKIAMWAWAAMRIVDYAETLESIDKDNLAVIGHSRLGKTALVAGGFDERIRFVISNNSGCSGAALTRGKEGETRTRITDVFPYWFCPRYKNDRDREDGAAFDQHFLMALTVPRHLLVGSAEEDLWADPLSEFLGLAAVNPAYGLYGMRGLVHGDLLPVAKTVLDEGDSCYHVRKGLHYLSREDWQVYMNYIKAHLND